ncbi:unnamed protein product, partial [Polarella glacialis]
DRGRRREVEELQQIRREKEASRSRHEEQRKAAREVVAQAKEAAAAQLQRRRRAPDDLVDRGQQGSGVAEAEALEPSLGEAALAELRETLRRRNEQVEAARAQLAAKSAKVAQRRQSNGASSMAEMELRKAHVRTAMEVESE